MVLGVFITIVGKVVILCFAVVCGNGDFAPVADTKLSLVCCRIGGRTIVHGVSKNVPCVVGNIETAQLVAFIVVHHSYLSALRVCHHVVLRTVISSTDSIVPLIYEVV